MPFSLPRLLAATALCAMLFGCATYPTEEERANADYGPELTSDEYISKIREAMELRLKDPDSAQYKIVSIQKAFYPGGPVARFRTTTYGHNVKFLINARNSYGGYTGYTGYIAFFQGDKILTLDEQIPGL